MSNQFPEFFDQAPKLQVYDPLAQFLGATPTGIFEYSYADAVKLCGHSCPTVASAYLMAIKALIVLYPNSLPERGNITVAMRGARDSGTTGVTASVLTLLTGAAAETGFGGIGAAGRFARRNLLHYGEVFDGEILLCRQDTQEAVMVSFNGSIVPFAPAMRDVMPKAVSGTATPAELDLFGQLWQARVKAILVDEVNHPDLVLLQKRA